MDRVLVNTTGDNFLSLFVTGAECNDHGRNSFPVFYQQLLYIGLQYGHFGSAKILWVDCGYHKKQDMSASIFLGFFTIKLDLVPPQNLLTLRRRIPALTLFQTNQSFIRVCSTSLLKPLREKVKLFIMSHFYLFPQSFLAFWITFHHFNSLPHNHIFNDPVSGAF